MDVVGRIKIAAQHALIRLSHQGFDHVTASRVVVLIITDRWGTHGPDVAILAVFSPSGFVGLMAGLACTWCLRASTIGSTCSATRWSTSTSSPTERCT